MPGKVGHAPPPPPPPPPTSDLKTGDLSGIKNLDEIKGLDSTKALDKLSTGISKLDKNIADSEKRIADLEKQIDSHNRKRDHYQDKVNNEGCFDSKKTVNGWRDKVGHHKSEAKKLQNEIKDIRAEIGKMQSDIRTLTKAIVDVKASTANELAENAKNLDECLKSNDLSGAIMLVLGNRSDNLKAGIDHKLKEIDARNAAVKKLTDEIASLDPKKDAKAIKKKEGQINELNGLNQTEMIRLQTMMNRYNQTNEMMSNLIQKLSRAMEGIISNMK